MPTISQTPHGVVSALWGSALIRGADGRLRVLKLGDAVHKGDAILTSQNGIVQLSDEDSERRASSKVPPDEVDLVIEALNRDDPRAATAAGPSASVDGALASGLRVERIAFGLNDSGFAFRTTGILRDTLVGLSGNGADSANGANNAQGADETPLPAPIAATSSVITANEEGAPVSLGLMAAGTITATRVPTIGQILRADGSVVGLGATLTASELAGLVYVPPADYDGSAPVGSFGYTVTSGDATASGATTIALSAVNDAPIATAASTSGLEDAVLPVSLGGSDRDGSVTSITVTGIPARGALLLADGVTAVQTGQVLTPAAAAGLLFRPAADYNGVTGIGYFATDNEGFASAPAQLRINVIAVNDLPIARDDATPTAINLPVTVAVLGNDSDVESGALIVTSALLANPALGTVSINADGSLTVTPALNVSGPVVVIYAIADADGATDNATLTVNVGANTPPAGADATRTLAEDSSYTVLVSDFGYADADAVQSFAALRIDALPAAGVLRLDGVFVSVGQLIAVADIAAGQLVYAPAPNGNGTGYASFSFSVRDSAGAFDATPNALAFDVTAVNDAPVVGSGSGSVSEDTVLSASGTLTVSDPDLGEAAFVPQGSTAGAYGSFTLAAGGAWSYTLNNALPAVQALGAGASLAETFVVNTVDGTPSSVSITINGSNDTPVAVADTGSTAEDTPLAGNVLDDDSDVDGPALTLTQFVVGGVTYAAGASAALAGIGTLSMAADGSYSFTPAANSNGPVPVATYTASDGLASTTATLTLVVIPVNDPPVAGDDLAATPINTPVTIAVLANDSDVEGGPLIVGNPLLADPALGSAVANGDGTITFTPAVDASGPIVLSYTLTDPAGASDTASVTVFVGTNTPPNGADTTRSFAEDGSYTLSVSDFGFVDTDAGQSFASVRIDALPVAGQLLLAGAALAPGSVVAAADVAAGRLVFVPAANASGAPYSNFAFSVQDSAGAFDSAPNTYTFNVTPVNDAPVAAADTASTPEDTAVSGNVLANDVDIDGPALSVTQFVINGSTVAAGSTAAMPGIGTLIIDTDGTYTFTPAPNYNGPVPQAAYTASDGSLTITSTLTLNVTPVNDAPVGVADVTSTPEDTPTSGNLLANDSDVDGPALSVTQFVIGGTTFLAGSAAAIPGVGSLLVNGDGGYTFTPVADYNGAVPVVTTYTVSDGSAIASATLTLSVTAVNDAPVAVADTGTTAEDTPLTGNLIANDSDIDGPALSVTQFVVAGNNYAAGTTATLTGVGTLLINADGSYTFTPAANYNGPVPVATYTVSDGSLTSTSTLTLNVTAVNDAPIAVADSGTTPEDTPLSGNVLANDGDVDGPALSVTQFVVAGNTFVAGSSATLAGVGTLVINADGGYTFTPSLDYNGPVPVATYTVSDGSLASTSTLGLEVTPVNDAPLAVADTGTTAEDTPLSGNVLANDSDVDGPALGVTQFVVNGSTLVAGSTAAIPGVGTLRIDSDGSYTFTPVVNYYGPVPVATYTVSDGSATTTSTLALDVTPVNDAPIGVADIVSTPEDTPVSGNVLGNDSDVDGPALAVTQFVIGGNTYAAGATAIIGGIGTLVIASDGSYTLTPTADYNGAVPAATYTVSDGALTSTSTLALAVTQVDDAPVGVADVATAVEAGGVGNATTGVNPTGNVLANDTDVDSGDTRTVSAVAGASAGAVGGATAGSYGSLVLDADGSYTYSVDNNNTAVQALRSAADTLTDTFTYTVRDAAGLTSTTTLTVTIQGANDAPIATVDSGSLTENTILAATAATGVLGNDSDVDAGDMKTVSAVAFGATAGAVGSALAGTYGSLTLGADGSYSYAADLPAADALAAGQTATEVFGYTMRDVAGATSTTTVTFTLTGTNDAPVAIADAATTSEDAAVSGNVLANDSDVDAGTTLAVTQFIVAGVAGTFPAGATANIAGVGTLTIIADGNYTFTPAANYNGAVPVATYTVSDGSLASTASLALSVTAVNDAPIAVADVASAIEAGGVSNTSAGTDPTGNVLANDTDVDSGDTRTVSAVSGAAAGSVGGASAGSYGTLVLDPDGSYTYSVDNNNAAVQALRMAADTLTDSFTYTVRDAAGLTASTNLTVTIQGANDAPIATVDTGSLAENTTLSAAAETGVLANDSDVDAGDTKTVSAVFFGATAGTLGSALAGTYGSLTLSADGSYSYSANQLAADALAAGQTATEVFGYTMRDAAGAASTTPLSFTITGTNDAPVAVADAATTQEDAAVSGNVLANDSDVDTGTTLSVTQFTVDGVAGTFAAGATANIAGIGTLTIAADGNYTYTPAANYNGAVPLATYTISDGSLVSTSTLALDVTAVNDAPVAAADIRTTLEDTVATGNVLANDSDVDGPALSVTQFSVAGVAGIFTAGTTATIAGIGTLTIAADGNYTFTPAANYNGAVPVATYTVTDGSLTSNSTFTIDVTAVNDAPVAVADSATAVEAGGVANASAGIDPSGNVFANDADVDAGDTQAVSAFAFGPTAGTLGSPLAGAYGSLTLNTDGSYSYAIDNANATVQALRSSADTLTESYSYTVRDAAGLVSSTTLTITIQGSNDAPVALADVGSVAEGATLSASAAAGVLGNDTDVDAADAKTVSAVAFDVTTGTVGTALAGIYGTLTLNADGSYDYAADRPAADTLAAGQSATEAFSYTMRDAAGAVSTTTLTFALTGVNDAPVAVTDTRSTLEDTAASGNVLANDSDVDAGTTLSVTQFTLAGVAGTFSAGSTATIASVGSLTIASNGDYTFTPAANYNGAVPVATYTVSDGSLTSTSTLTLNVTPVNDAPLGVADVATAVEAGGVANATTGLNPSGNVLANDTDVDAGDSRTVVAVSGVAAGVVGGTTTGSFGTLALNTDGSYTYSVDNNNAAVQALRIPTDSLVDSFTYTLRDAAGLIASTTLTVTIQGANDAPMATVDTGSLTENTTLAASAATGVLANDNDVDAGDTKTVFAVSFGATAGTVGSGLTGTYGTFTSSADGSYSYVTNRPAADALAAGQTATEVFSYTMRDTAGATSTTTVTFTITGTNDAPVAVADARTTAEDTAASGNVLANDSDLDTGATLSVTQFTVAGVAGTFAASATANIPGIGTLTIAANGDYTFTPATDYNGPVPVATYTVTDGITTATSTLAINVTPVNDAPVAVADTGTTPEDTPLSGNVLANDSDVDGPALSVTQFVLAGSTYVAGATATLAGIGSLVIAGDGSYTFTPGANYNGPVPVATYTVSDGTASATSTLALSITAVNDAPVAVADVANVNEDAPSVSGDVTPAAPGQDSDVDGDAFSVIGVAAGTPATPPAGGVGAEIAGNFGSVTIAADGSYSYVPGAAAQALRAGQSATDGFTYTISDGNGGTAYASLTVTVQGADDAPVIGGPLAGSVTEDGVTVATGTLTISDADAGQSSFIAQPGTAGTYGTFSITSAGVWSYTLNNAAANVQALGEGAAPVEIFVITSVDGGTRTVLVTVSGSNDAPIAVADVNTIAEGGTPAPATVSGDVTPGTSSQDRDIDAGSSFSVTGVAAGTPAAASGNVGSSVNGAYGSIVIAADGSYDYTLDNARAATNALAAGQTASEVFTYTITDDNGATSSATLSITITGTNDAPLAVVDTGSTFEDTPLSGNVLTNDSDADGPALSVTQFVVAGNTYAAGSTATLAGIGTLVIDSAGGYTFAPAANYNGAVPVATYTLSDGALTSTATLTLNVTSVNDAPVAVADANSVSEDDPGVAGDVTPGTSGQDSDIDGDALSVVGVAAGTPALPPASGVGAAIAGSFGSVTISADGSYSYVPGAAAQSLAAGQSATDVFTYTISDSNGGSAFATLTITVQGANDAPAIGGPLTGSVTEDGTTVATGALSIADPDAGQSSFVEQPGTAGTYGTFSITAAGLWTYTSSNAAVNVQALAQGAAPTESFVIASTDGSTRTVEVSVNGSNDAPIAVADLNAITESSTTTPGTVSGDVTLAASGQDRDIDNGSSFTVTGVAAGTPASASGNVGASVNGSYGSVVINADGSYTYTLDNTRPATNALASGQTASEVFTYTITDNDGATASTTLTITVTGTNDAPLALNDSVSTPEDTPLAGNVLGNDSDPEGSPLTITQFTVAGVVGTFAAGSTANIAGIGTLVIDTDGSYIFAPAADYNGPVPVATYTVTDGLLTSTSTLGIAVTAANDAPVGVVDVATAVEAGGVSNSTAGFEPSGNVLANDTDVDAGDSRTVSAVSGVTAGVVGGSTTGSFGTLVLNADGSYTYSVDNNNAAVQALRAATNTLTDSFTYTVRDAAGLTASTTLTVTIQGANDAPIATVDTGSLTRDTILAVNATTGVLANDSDVDAGDSKTVSAVSFGVIGGTVASGLAGTYGTFTLNADGSYDYAANRPAADALAPGQTVTEVFSYTLRDAAGATSTTTVTFTITGTNDAPVAVADARTTAEDSAASGNVLTNDSDVDVGTTLSVTQFVVAGVAGTFAAGATATIAGVGTLTIATNGNYTFTPAADFNGAVPVATYTVSDGTASTTSTLTINVTPTNDAPAATADTATAVEAGGVANATAGINPSGNVLANDTDVDAGDTRTVSAVSGSVAGTVGGSTAGSYGTLLLNADGSYTYTVNNANAAVQALRTATNALTDTFSYTVRDGGGLISTTTLTVTIRGTNDAPVAVADIGSLTENATLNMGTASGVLANDTDVDAGDTKTVSAFSFGATTGTVGVALSGTYGTFTLNADGSYSYAADRPAAEALAAGQTATEVFSYTMRDSAGAASTTTVTFTITGSNDSPVAVADTRTTGEDTAASGNVLANDSDVDAGAVLAVTQFTLAGVPGTFAAGSTAMIAGVGTLLIAANGNYTFAPAANYNGAVPVATYTLSDGTASSTSTLTINVTPVNDAPVNSVPGTQSTNEDTARVFSAANGNAITVADVDGGTLTTTIAVGNGTLTLGSTAGVTVSGDGSASVQITGTAAAINAALNGSSFQPAADFSGSSTLAVTTSDGSAGDIDSVAIGVTALADAPTLYAHASPATVAIGSNIFTDTFNDGNFTTPAWTRMRLTQNTFTDDPASSKGQSEATLFTNVTSGGQTTNTEFNNFWTVFSNQVHYNRNGGAGSDDAQGMLAYQNLSAADRARTNYSVSADMSANPGSGQNNGGGFVFGYQNGNDYFLARWENPGVDYQVGGAQYNNYPGQANQFSLVQMVGGVPIDLGVFNGFTTPGIFNLRIDVSNLGIQVYANDGALYDGTTPLVSYAYSSVAGGASAPPALNTIGLYTFDNDAGVVFDNVRVDRVNYSYALDLQATLNDTDGSESLSAINLANLPAGVALNGAGGPITVTGGSATIAATSGVETTITMTSSTPLTVAQINTIQSSVTATDGGGSTAVTTVSVKAEILGTGGVNALTGSGADEWLEGRGGNDTLNAGAGDDVLLSGSGNDTMTGGIGADVFAWQLVDRGALGAPARDVINDFNVATPAAGGDVLDLRDLLQSETSGNLTQYLDFDTTSTPGSTVIRISSSGGFAGGTYAAGQEDQRITLSGVDLRASFGLSTGASDNQIITELINRGKLVTDAA